MRIGSTHIAHVVAALLVTLPCLTRTATGQELKPLGAWFGGYERLTFDDEIAWGDGAYVVSHYSDAEFYTPFRVADLDRYSAVFIGRGGGKALTKDEQSALQKWVAKGGSLILSGEEGQRLFGNEPPAWLGIERWLAGKPVKCAIQQPEHPLAKGLPQVETDPAWQTTTGVAAKAGSVSVIGKDGLSLLLVANHEKGRIVYLGGSLTPQARPAYREKSMVHDLSPLARAVWSNLLRYLGTPRRTDVIRKGLADREGASLRFWWRFQKSTTLGARLYTPPFPKREDELAELSLDLGRGERYRRAFFVTSLREQKLTVRMSDLEGPDKSVIPASSCQVFVQDRPVPGYDKAGYWLVPIKDAVALQANESYTFWMILRSPESKPGVYRGALEFRDAGDKERVTARLPIQVRLWDVRYPGSDLLHYELEHIWFTMPGGYWVEKDKTRKVDITLDGKPLVSTPIHDVRVLGNYIRSLGELEVDFAQNWSDVDRLYPMSFLRLRKDGKLLSEALEQHPEQFRGESLPALDFSEGYDDRWNIAIPAGMRYLAMNYQLAGDGSLRLAQRIAKDPKLQADSDLARRVRKWYWSEYVKYLRERGLQGVYTKIHDEFGPAGVPDFIKNAEAIRPAGIMTYTTSYNFDRDKKSVMDIDPFLDKWQMAWPKESPFELFREKGIPFEASNEVWGTTASSFWGNGDGARAAGWLAARLGYKGIHTHGYMRWFWNDHEGCFPGPDGPFNSVAMMNTAQGMVEGRYLAQLRRLIDRGRRMGRAMDVVNEVDREWQRTIIGTDADCLLRLRHQPRMTGIDATWWPDIGTSPAVYETARRKVFELSARLEKALGPMPRDVAFGDFPLVTAGKAVCRVDGPSMLTKAVPELADSERQKALTADAPVILVGSLNDNAALRQFVERHLSEEITTHYPRPGRYAIRSVPASKTSSRTILIVGGDREGTETGIRNFIRLLTVEGR
jgi:hypothetical protein